MKELIIAWILSMMTTVSPPHREHFIGEAQESYAQADQRYREIAEAIVDTAYDPSVQPLFRGQYGRASTAMLVASIWFMESGFRRDIDLGTSRVRLRRAGLNDFGRSWCMGQINLGSKKVQDPDHPGRWVETSERTTPEGWTGPDLLSDRRKCAAATIRVLRSSLGGCRHLPISERLALYAAGTCDSEEGRSASRVRMSLFHKWNNAARPDVKDSDVLPSDPPKLSLIP
jgi:hypothetical protein